MAYINAFNQVPASRAKRLTQSEVGPSIGLRGSCILQP